MVTIPSGRFRMGSAQGNETEMPVREVLIRKPFLIGRYETTLAEFSEFVEDTAYVTDAERSSSARAGCYVFGNGRWRWDGKANWRDPGFSQTQKDPVTCVSWNDAKAYIEWQSSRSGQQYRLPSEAEWEYAARARSYTSYSFGNEANDLCRYGNGADRTMPIPSYNVACSDGVGAATAPVASYLPNDFGLYDVHGNVWEWVEDCHHANYQNAPTDERAWVTLGCEARVQRGGSWYGTPEFLRSAFRGKNKAAYRFSNSGFRLARDR